METPSQSKIAAVIILLLIAATVILLILSVAGVITERLIFINSFQYQESRNQEVTNYEAQLAEINAQLINPDLDTQTRANLQAQKNSITVLLRAAKEKQK